MTRSREAPWRDCLSAGQTDSGPHLPGSQTVLWFHAAQYSRQNHRGQMWSCSCLTLLPIQISTLSFWWSEQTSTETGALTSLIKCCLSLLEVSTHPLTGRVDEGYRRHLAQRYKDLMESLKPLGYKAALHPTLSEFIVNTYGILQQRPGSTRAMDYRDPDLLRRWITATACPQLEKEVQIFLNCLCHMAGKDGNPFILW